MITYFSWWYGEALTNYLIAIKVMVGKVYSFFSIRVLIKTLFDPWKRDAYSVENASLQARMKIWLDNMISRLVGFAVRLFTVLLGLAAILLFFVLLLVGLLVWLAFPILVLGLIINGARIMING